VSSRDLGPLVVTMAPIPNPADLPPRERERFYGHRYYHEHRIEHVYGAAPVRVAHPIRIAAPVHPAAVVQAPKPVAPTYTPVVQAPPVVAPKPAPKLVQLQTAVGQIVAQGSNLVVSPDIAQGKPGAVSLSLPANLLNALRDQAAQFGFKRAARSANVSATLSGDGYSVTPGGAQTQALKAGQAANFAWQVTPGPNANGPLHAHVDAALQGQGAPKLLSLATLQSAVAQATVQTQQTVSGLHLPSFSHFLAKLFGKTDQTPAQPAAATPAPQAAATAPTDTSGLQSPLHDRDLPIVGHVTVRAQIAAFLAFLAVLILLLIQRSMAEQRKTAERRRFRSMTGGYRPMDMDSEPVGAHEPTPEPSI
jgi:hypothetical protein